MKQTKEQLIAEITKLRTSHERWVSGDERRRREFAKAFGWIEVDSPASYRGTEPEAPTWEQIFVKVGRLLNEEMVSRTVKEMEGLKAVLGSIQQRLDNESRKNN